MQLWVANVATGRDDDENEHKQKTENKEGDDTSPTLTGVLNWFQAFSIALLPCNGRMGIWNLVYRWKLDALMENKWGKLDHRNSPTNM